MTKKTQVLIIHGGETFKRERDYLHYLKTRKVSTEKRINWAGDYLEKSLGKSFEVIRPRMPLQEYAKYRDWKIVFERYLPLLKGDFVLMGNSLGGIFLAKYLSENKLSKKAVSVCLSCAPFDDTMPNDDLAGGFTLKSNLSLLEENTRNLHLFFSKDDKVVPPSQAEKYRKKLKNADIMIYKSMNGHFNVPKFPEIIKVIKADVRTA